MKQGKIEATLRYMGRSKPIPMPSCPSCGEWETIILFKEASWWQQLFRGWRSVFECPRCGEEWRRS